jgi:hypothetical protein
VKVVVHDTGCRPVQVGSHFHFFEVNRYLQFDREAAFGKHLKIPATTAIRFEPGEEKEVELVACRPPRATSPALSGTMPIPTACRTPAIPRPVPALAPRSPRVYDARRNPR